MRISIQHGPQPLDLDLADGQLIAHHRGPAALDDPAAAVRDALEKPFDFPALRRALTPDDHVTLVADESLPGLDKLLVPVLDHIVSTGVAPANITLLISGPADRQWVRSLPAKYAKLTIEDHDPATREKLAYLATTEKGLRLYLNRTLVDADQVVVLTTRHYDPILGHGGAEGDIFPALADEVTRTAVAGKVPAEPPVGKTSPAKRQASEVTWLLGQPFFVQVIPSQGGGVAQVVAGAGGATQEGQQLLDAGWRRSVHRRADIVLVTLAAQRRITFADLAWAAYAASRVVKPNGRIVVLCPGSPEPGEGAEVLINAEEPQIALAVLEKAHKSGTVPAILWARAVSHAHVSLLSGLPTNTVEDLFASPLSEVSQVQRLISSGEACVILEDAQFVLPVLE